MVRSQRALVPGDEVKICLNEFGISILFIDHKDHSELHKFYLQQLGQRLSKAVPGINQLNFKSKDGTLTQRDTSYHLLTVIGSGVFGTVYRAIHPSNGDRELVAVKVFRKNGWKTLKEAAILQSLSHVCKPLVFKLAYAYILAGEYRAIH